MQNLKRTSLESGDGKYCTFRMQCGELLITFPLKSGSFSIYLQATRRLTFALEKVKPQLFLKGLSQNYLSQYSENLLFIVIGFLLPFWSWKAVEGRATGEFDPWKVTLEGRLKHESLLSHFPRSYF